jgi:yeast amino acid transporter
MLLGYKLIMKTHTYRPEEADLWTGKDIIDADEQMWLEKEAADQAAGRGAGWLYRHTLGYLF